MGLFDFYKWLNFIFDFNVPIYSKCSTIALDCDYLVSQMTNFIIPVENYARMFAWCWMGKK